MKNLILILSILFISCNGHYEDITTCYKIKNKHMENESIGTNGNFEVVHYFLMTDGTLKKVDIKDYLSYNIGDNVCFIEHHVLIKDTIK